MTPNANAAQGWIRLTIHGSTTGAIVRARIDGHAVDVVAPTTVVPVAPGRHRLEVESSIGFTTYGETRADVDVAAGQAADYFYAVPKSMVSKGELGTTPQPRRAGLDMRQVAVSIGGGIGLICLCGLLGGVWKLLFG